MRFLLFSLTMLALLTVTNTGCPKPEDSNSQQHSDNADGGHTHDHAHGHGDHDDHPAHGPKGGHLFQLDSDDIQVEWKQRQDNNVVKMYLLTTDEEPKPIALKVDSFKVIPQAGNDTTPFVLEPENADDEGKASEFSMDDQLLRTSIHLGNDIEIVTSEKTYKGQIKAHEPMDH